MADSKKKQEAFWQTMMCKYEKRNNNLKQQQCDLMQRIKKMEDTMHSKRAKLGNMKAGASASNTQCSCDDSSPSGSKPGASKPGASKPLKKESGKSIPRCDCKERGATCDCSSCDLIVDGGSSCVCKICEPAAPPKTATRSTPNIAKPKPSNTACDCGESESGFSIESSDLLYMSKINELATREQQMRMKIRELENREQVYETTLKQADEMFALLEESYKKRVNNAQQGGDNKRKNFDNMSNQLREQNMRLTNEVEDVKLELKQCMERIQGPLCRKLEQERRKAEQLQKELQCSCQSMSRKEMSHMEDMSGLKNQLNCTCANMADLNCTNDALKKEMCQLKCKYDQLQQDLINQKISEARTLEQLNEALAAEKARCAENATGKGKNRDCKDKSLGEIARSLSETLLEIKNCSECSDMPSDLKDTVQGIKVICDLVDNQNKKMSLGGSGGSGGGGPGGPGGPDGSDGPEGPWGQVGPGSPTDDNGGKDDVPKSPGPGSPNCECLPADQPDDTCVCDNEVSMQDGGKVGFMEARDRSRPISETFSAEGQDVEVITEIEADQDMDIEVETEVKLPEAISSEINITTTITGSGMLEIVSEAHTGLIETKMTYSETGQIEVTTAITDYTDNDQISAVAKSSFVISKQSVTMKESASVYQSAIPSKEEPPKLQPIREKVKTKSVEFAKPPQTKSKVVKSDASEVTKNSKYVPISSEVQASPLPIKETHELFKFSKTISEPLVPFLILPAVTVAIVSEAGDIIKARSSTAQVKVEEDEIDGENQIAVQEATSTDEVPSNNTVIAASKMSKDYSSVTLEVSSEGTLSENASIVKSEIKLKPCSGVISTALSEIIEVKILHEDESYIVVEEKTNECKFDNDDDDEYYILANDSEDFSNEISEAIDESNKYVLLAVEQANQEVREAFKQANKDVENALAEALASQEQDHCSSGTQSVFIDPVLIIRDAEALIEKLKSEEKYEFYPEAIEEISATASVLEMADVTEEFESKARNLFEDVCSSFYQTCKRPEQACVDVCASIAREKIEIPSQKIIKPEAFGEKACDFVSVEATEAVAVLVMVSAEEQKSETVSAPPAKLAKLVSAPSSKFAEIVREPLDELAKVVSAPPGESEEIVNAPSPKLTDVVSAPQRKLAKIVSAPPVKGTKVVSAPTSESAEVVNALPPKLADVVSAPQSISSEIVSAPPAKGTKVVSAPTSESAEVVNALPPKLTDVVSAPQRKLAKIVSAPPVKGTKVVGSPTSESIEVVNALPPKLADVVSAPQSISSEIVSAPPAKGTKVISTPTSESAEVVNALPPKLADVVSAPQSISSEIVRELPAKFTIVSDSVSVSPGKPVEVESAPPYKLADAVSAPTAVGKEKPKAFVENAEVVSAPVAKLAKVVSAPPSESAEIVSPHSTKLDKDKPTTIFKESKSIKSAVAKTCLSSEKPPKAAAKTPNVPAVEGKIKLKIVVKQSNPTDVRYESTETLQKLIKLESRSETNSDELPSEAGDAIHSPDCDCVDCLCNLCKSNPKTPKCHLHPITCVCVDCLCNEEKCNLKVDTEATEHSNAEKTTFKKSDSVLENVNELEDIVKQIKCACDEAELRGGISAKKIDSYIGSYENTLSGVQLTLSNLQNKCNKKDEMIHTMIQELKVRSGSKVLNKMLNNLSSKYPNVLEDLWKTGSVPEPKEEDVICQVSDFLDYPIYPPPKLTKEKFQKRHESNYPNFHSKTTEEQAKKFLKPSRLNRSNFLNSKDEFKKPSKKHESQKIRSKSLDQDKMLDSPDFNEEEQINTKLVCPRDRRKGDETDRSSRRSSNGSPDFNEREQVTKTLLCPKGLKKGVETDRSKRRSSNTDGSPDFNKGEQVTKTLMCPKGRKKGVETDRSNRRSSNTDGSPDFNEREQVTKTLTCPKGRRKEDATHRSNRGNLNTDGTPDFNERDQVTETLICPKECRKGDETDRSNRRSSNMDRSPDFNEEEQVNRKLISKGRRKGDETDRSTKTKSSNGMEVVDARKLSSEILFVKWKPPINANVNGYKICVNNKYKFRISNALRTSAVLEPLEVKSTVRIDIYAMTLDGLCKPPATAVYQV